MFIENPIITQYFVELAVSEVKNICTIYPLMLKSSENPMSFDL